MCSSKTKVLGGGGINVDKDDHMNGRPVLQPNCSNITITSRTTTTTTNTTTTTLLYRRCHSMKKPSTTTTTTNKPLLPPLQPPPKITSSPTTGRIPNNKAATPPVSPKLKSPRPPAVKRSSVNNNDPTTTPKTTTTKTSSLVVKKSKVVDNNNNNSSSNSLKYSSSLIVESPGSIAAARREAVANMQVQRKMKIAHYGRTKSANFERRPLNNNDLLLLITPPILQDTTTITARSEDKRCNFITANSDPIYIAYHDEEWGVPVHDDRMLFELLLLTGAQVGSDWTSVLKRRQDFRDAFSGFDAESVSKYTEKKITSISADYGIEVSLVRGVVDNSKRILEIKRQFGSFDKYLWAFVNHKPIATQYKSCFKIPVKTSKSETISKDMVKKGFRLVGPTVIHSFMQAAGLTNDHLLACPRHLQCVALASQSPTVAPAL